MAANPYRFLPAVMIQAKLDKYSAAEDAILNNQSYSMDGVSLTRANLAEVRTAIGQLAQALRLQNGQAVTVVTPRVRMNCGY